MRYLFLDIDNTLYSPAQGCIPSSALQAISSARKNGSKVFLCTGRSLAESADYLQLPIDGFVFASGAMCYAEGKRVYDHPIEAELIQEVEQLIHSCGMGVLLGGSAGAYVDSLCRTHLEGYLSGGDTDQGNRLAVMLRNGMYSYADRHPADPIYKLGASVEHGGSFEELRTRLPEALNMIVTITSSSGDFAEITDKRINKATGIQQILKTYGAEMEEAVGIGDSGNDIEMIRACGVGIAMGNAFPEVKEAADWVTTHIDEDGLRNAFLHVGVITE